MRELGWRTLSQTILKRTSYVDSIRVYVDRQMDDVEYLYLEGCSGSSFSLKDGMPSQESKWPSGVHLNQPSRKALEYLRDGFSRYIVTRLDVALDLETLHLTAAEDLYEYLARRIVKRNHKVAVFVYVGTRGKDGKLRKVPAWRPTIYWDRANSLTNLVLYVYRKSDATFCCHLEWRMHRHAAVKSAGFQTLDAVLEADHAAFWKARLKLRDLPSRSGLQAIGRAASTAHKRRVKLPMYLPGGLIVDRFPMHGNHVLMATSVPHRESWAVQDVVDFYGHKWMKHFPLLPISWMLPTPIV